MGDVFKGWRWKLGVLSLVVIGFVVWLAMTALKAEERLIAVIYTVQLVEEYMKQNEGDWPKSWDVLDSTVTEIGSYYDSERPG